MPGHDIIVIGASAGGIEALIKLVSRLPGDLPAALFIVIHFAARGKSMLPKILSHEGQLLAAHATDHEAIVHGRIYIASPDRHLLVKQGFIRSIEGPKENGFRPAVDPLFRTAAKAYKQRVVGVVLSGALDDGTAGLIDVKQLGGIALVQNPSEALFASMPQNAINHAVVDQVLPVTEIAATLVHLAHEPVAVEGGQSMSELHGTEYEMEPDIVELDGAGLRQRGTHGPASGFICPDCGGTLYELQERDFLQYRCRVGHAWSANSLMAEQAEAQEQAMWAAVRSLEERADLMQRMAQDARQHNRMRSTVSYEMKARSAEYQSDIIRQALIQGQLPQPVATGAAPLAEFDPLLPFPNAAYNVVVLVGAEGGIAALRHVLPGLSLSFPAAVIVIQQPDSQSSYSLSEDLFSRIAPFPITQAAVGVPLQPGKIYIAPSNQHLLINPNGTLDLTQAAFVNWQRPSADLLLQSVAATFRHRAIAVILSGAGRDGVSGMVAIHEMGGKVIAQAEDVCEFFELPNAAIQTGKVDAILELDEIASYLTTLVVRTDEESIEE